MKNILLYAAGILLTGYLAVIYRSQILAGLMAAEILIPLPLILLAAYTVRKVKIQISVQTSTVERGHPVSVLLLVDNPSLFPVIRGEAEIVYWNQFRGKKSVVRIPVQSAGKSRGEIYCEWESSHCGNLCFQVRSIRNWDYLKLTSFRRRSGASGEAAVLPVPYELVLPEENRQIYQEDGEKYDPHRGGDDPSEIFQLREYRQGDRLSSIHWKMTARSEELIVKEYSRPLKGGGLLFLDLFLAEADGSWIDPDPYLDLVFSLCLALLEEQRSCQAVWREENSGELKKIELEGQESVYELLGCLFRTAPYRTQINLEETYKEQFPLERPAFSYRLDLQGRLWEGGNILWENGRMTPSG